MSDYVLIKKENLNQFANHARRLAGVENELTIAEMLAIFAAVPEGSPVGVPATDEEEGGT